MRHRQLAVLALAMLALAAAAPAAEWTGHRIPAAPGACAAPFPQLAPPAMLTPATAAAEPLAVTAARSCQFQCLPMGCETCWIDTKCVEHCCSCNDPRCAPPC